MNKKLIAWVSVAVVAGILLLWTVLRHSPFGQSHNLGNDTIGIMLSILGLPMRLYVIFVSGENSSWSLPVLVLCLALSGLMWGFIVERVVWILSKRKHTHKGVRDE
jgi:flagellar biosynthesis protein FliR